MHVKLEIADDADLRSAVKDLIRGQVRVLAPDVIQEAITAEVSNEIEHMSLESKIKSMVENRVIGYELRTMAYHTLESEIQKALKIMLTPEMIERALQSTVDKISRELLRSAGKRQ
ncbi:MAG: hypothetical protein M1281_02855 [Chloroflexi bacterium]|nr:hypothetical protein [Chloroflexota bacterium]